MTDIEKNVTLTRKAELERRRSVDIAWQAEAG